MLSGLPSSSAGILPRGLSVASSRTGSSADAVSDVAAGPSHKAGAHQYILHTGVKGLRSVKDVDGWNRRGLCVGESRHSK